MKKMIVNHFFTVKTDGCTPTPSIPFAKAFGIAFFHYVIRPINEYVSNILLNIDTLIM